MTAITFDTPATLHLLIISGAIVLSAATGAIASRLLNGVLHRRPRRVPLRIKTGSRQLLQK